MRWPPERYVWPINLFAALALLGFAAAGFIQGFFQTKQGSEVLPATTFYIVIVIALIITFVVVWYFHRHNRRTDRS